MDLYNARQVSTTFADESSLAPTSVPPSPMAAEGASHAGRSSTTVEYVDHSGARRAISLLSCTDASRGQSATAEGHCSGKRLCGLDVTKGCRSCIDDSCKEQQCEYFLKQKCPLSMAWNRIAGDAPSTMETFEEHAAHSLRSSNSIANLQSTASRGSLMEGSERRGNARMQRTRAAPTAPRTRWSEDAHGSRTDAAEEEGAAVVEAEEEEEAACVMPPPRFGHTAVLYKDSQIVIFGGKANDEHYYNDVYAYDVERRRWAMLQAEDTQDDEATAATTTTRGAEASASAAPAGSHRVSARFSPSSTASTPCASRESSVVDEHHSRFHPQHSSDRVRGADDEDNVRVCSNADIFIPFAMPVATRTVLRPCGRVGHAAALYQSTMYILSGERQGKYFDDMWALDVPSLAWSKECGLPFSPRKGHTMHLLPAECTATRAREDMFVVFGGLVKASRVHPRPADPELPARNAGEPDMMCAPTNETLLFYPTQRRWCQLKTCGDTPTPRFYHVSQLVTGTTLLLLFGGRTVDPTPVGVTTAASEGSFMNDLRMLDVSTGVWRQIRDATGDVPSPRMCAASVFVNGTFAVFAGGGDGYCKNAYEFQLGANRWRRLTPNDQPACSRPTVIYAKDRLVFFGGFAPRMGVLNCTMELCLAPLSLMNQCLLWWNRCAFEKHIRTCTQNRILGQEEKAAAMSAMVRCRKASGGGGRQVTLRRSPANFSCSPVPTPRQSMVHRATRRPPPFHAPGYDHVNSWSSSMTPHGGGGGGGWCDVSLGSPSPSYAPSSPVMCSPLSGASQLLPSWQEAVNTKSSNSGGGGGAAAGYYGASFATGSFYHHGSPATAAATAPPAALRPASAFPSLPDTVVSSHVGTPPSTRLSTSSTTLLSVTAPWPRKTAGPAQSGGPSDAGFHHHLTTMHNSNCTYAGATASAGGAPQPATAAPAWGDGMQRNSARSSASGVTPVSSYSTSASARTSFVAPADGGQDSHPLASLRVSPREPADGGCRIMNCMRNITGFAATSFPRFYKCLPSPAGQRTNSSSTTGIGRGGGSMPACAYSSQPPSRVRSPVNSLVASHPLRIDVDACSPPSPQTTDMSDYPLSSPFAYSAAAAAASSALPSPFSQQQQQQRQQPPRQASPHFTESASSRASSVHSLRSTSPETAPLSHVTQLIQQLEGPNGPFVFRARPARKKETGLE
ncbi:putative Kelch-domain protein [Leptomonas pyrrhocoris]|uniref:Putative Kelch-domain protein n=1 Tax=Leptomonas pyrrhocoris TaxID=157538 RepID=A0A0M9FZ40_LEPPY|nr:putative Kelch-domain protein [Leptomonas pyrrhocoris]KPA79055.1 putative Kelch-domain protein [Leptomonas pyrrhocoris]|eukprot:XP_015657494.1 putative Kelch-domain protein [Leptomonas pyrrhocoris]